MIVITDPSRLSAVRRTTARGRPPLYNNRFRTRDTRRPPSRYYYRNRLSLGRRLGLRANAPARDLFLRSTRRRIKRDDVANRRARVPRQRRNRRFYLSGIGARVIAAAAAYVK